MTRESPGRVLLQQDLRRIIIYNRSFSGNLENFLDAYSSETQQVEEIKKWWRENGFSVVLGLTLGVSGIFGWRYWQDVKVEQSEAASVLYSDMIAAFVNDDTADARDNADRIVADYRNTTYGVFAMLGLARLAVADDDLDAAESHLREALEQNRDASFSHVIRTRLVRVLISQDKLDEAGSMINRQGTGEFASAYDELMGDISALQGDFEAARAAYQQSINGALAAGRDISTLELKLNNIGQ